jgi:hypothetical protein
MDQHFDAERLAAFMDGTLSAAERAAVEAHAADCAQCLQLLAAMVRTHEEPARTSRGAWRLPLFVRWAAPLAAAAAAVALWLNVAGEPPPPAQQPAEQATTTAPASAPERKKAPADQETPSRAAQGFRSIAKEKSAAAKDLAKMEVPREESREAFDRFDERARQGQPTAQRKSSAGALLAPSKVDTIATAPPPTSVLGAPVGTPAPPPAAPPPVTASVAEAAKPGSAAPASAVAETVTTNERRAADKMSELSAVRQRLANAAAIETRAPDQRYRWRVNGLVVERTQDGGATWAVVPGVPAAQLSAIAAPAPTVAWFVGRGGVVFLFADNASSRVPFPESIDLTAVRAVSAREATVTTADGRTFRTADGGQTWSPQEIPPSAF